MEREMKFRAFYKPRKKMYWFELWGNFKSGDGYIGMVPIGETREKGTSHNGNMILIDPGDCEITQFTGLKDKNRKDIYEGDIVKHKYRMWSTDEHVSQVEWDDLWCCFYLNDGIIKHRMRSDIMYKVIGNIYENPELLKTL